MSYEFYVARRYLKSKKKTGFISLITYISIGGVALGVAALIIVLSVMNGFETEVRSRFIGITSHIQIRDARDQAIVNYADLIPEIIKTAHVRAATPFVEDKALIMSTESSTGIVLRGIDPATASSVTDLQKNINFGSLELGAVDKTDEPTLPGIVLGFNLADRLIVTVGDIVTIYSISGIKQFGQMPYFKQFRVTGYFETGLYEYDDNMAYISLESAQKLFQTGVGITGIELRLDDHDRARGVSKELQKKFTGVFNILTWFDMNKNLFAAMELEKIAAFVILSLIILVAAFNIVSTLTMVTMEKTRDIGILKSLGATQSDIRRIFTLEGLVVGFIGTGTGFLLGFGFCWVQQTFRFFSLPTNIYIINWLPVIMKWSDFLSIGCAAVAITFLAAVYPAHRAGLLDPVAAIRYE
jgi:lipoprotein-releasing system permease protein